MKNNKLEIKKLNSFYGSSHILKNISFSLEENKVLSIVGKNGMGKTTLLNSLMGIVEKIEGTIFFQNKLISKLETQSLLNLGIAYVPDHRGIFKNLTVNENLELLNKKKSNWNKSRVLDCFPQLKNKLNNYGDQISGGEQQMLSIGRALLSNPSLLVVDEPSEGLSPIYTRIIWDLFEEIKNEGSSLIIVDREINALKKFSDYFLFLDKGEMLGIVKTSEIDKNKNLLEKVTKV
ncbi:MAG: ATP-binding cassette domain-containing protein [Hydrogenophilales bacterium]|jgi:branched-chain amino acid transport system ATP-binding protein|tara:strand:- start:2824 stop:3525 length:702 start_codon:yes stop_codon:yes gene_type:complete